MEEEPLLLLLLLFRPTDLLLASLKIECSHEHVVSKLCIFAVWYLWTCLDLFLEDETDEGGGAIFGGGVMSFKQGLVGLLLGLDSSRDELLPGDKVAGTWW